MEKIFDGKVAIVTGAVLALAVLPLLLLQNVGQK